MSSPLVFVRDGRTLPFIPVTLAALSAIQGVCDTPRRDGARRSYPHALATYTALLELANGNRTDRTAITQKALGDCARSSRSAVQSALGDLKEAMVLEIVERSHGAARIENEYVLVEPNEAKACGNPASQDDTPAREKSDPRPSEKQLSKEEKEEGGEGDARASKRYQLPANFPEELRPHLVAVYRILRGFAERHPNAHEVNPVSLAYVVMANPRKALVAAAHDYCSWWETRDPKDVVQGYRNNVTRRALSLASTERLDSDGVPVAGLPDGVTSIAAARRRTAPLAVNERPPGSFPDPNAGKRGHLDT